ncbi:hypothetical protein C1878_03965 [Gordonibacter sp. 28C]|uniref:sensor histidine kinase n=1 Tax=Gordonibacter sp. 28C TaxID=2078569 RepID=UPI000DF8241C|nr:GHKL domain-containing protein [Gordonibacter sp. 28C]RDB63952.1 hypothetical protein C1878_03965 [Gordonibacter sp. 28C]
MSGSVAEGILWYVVRNTPTFLSMFFLMLLAVRGRLRFSLKTTVGIALGIVVASSLVSGVGVVLFADEAGTWATIPLLAVSLASLAALTRLSWGKRLFVFFSAITAASIAILVYDVLLRTVALEWSFGARRVLDAAVCSLGPLALAPLFARTIRWGVEQIDDRTFWRRLAALPAAFFITANALYALAYAVEFVSTWANGLYALTVAVLGFLLAASYLVLFSALRTTRENARLREAAQLEGMQHVRYESLQRTLRDTAKARHDFRHQLLVIRSFAEENDAEGLRAFLDEQGAIGAEGERPAYASNFAVDAVAAHFAERARACGAETSFALALPERLSLPEADFCMALANLLENAVEACERVAGAGNAPQLLLCVEARVVAGGSVLVSVRNSCTDADARSLATAAPDGVLANAARSTKHAGEGIGLASVSALAHRYRGEVRAQAEDGVAEIQLLLRPERTQCAAATATTCSRAQR